MSTCRLAHTHDSSFATVMARMITYGHQIDPEYVRLLEDVRDSGAGPPASHLVDLISALKYILELMRISSGTHDAERVLRYGCVRSPMIRSKRRCVAIPCLISRPIETPPSTSDIAKDELIMNCTGAIYSAGTDSATITLTNFILAMILHPEIQQKAQAEIDAVVGRDRLPDFSDRASTPFIDCIVTEVLRWKPVTPLGIPHATSGNDIYRGMFIPKNTTVVPNMDNIIPTLLNVDILQGHASRPRRVL
ncbi:hypothetical protein PAXINDRAFT_103025 [Paxillus involutus ATCC 200175]|uniref:Cytochrome P450 n=1 Tax=Paxillus involutus ATCC 200175 TaxID=664439 RepID=A0A0C9SWP7_PAXIN|nr:hypothetical protein PAXINDRAFT_103025 [Paxillus involutus ATCC 200175]